MCEGLQVEEVILRSETIPRAWFAHFASVIQEFSLCRANKNHSVFWQIQDKKRILLVVYVDDIVITGDDTKEIDNLKKYSTFRPRILDP